MKNINFKYQESDGSANLGVPENIRVENGNFRDGGCMLKFKTSSMAIGIEEEFSLYLFAEDINRISREVWKKYLETEPERAREDFQRFINKINETL